MKWPFDFKVDDFKTDRLKAETVHCGMQPFR